MRDGCAERIQAVSETSPSLDSRESSESELDLLNHDIDTALSWSTQESRAKLMRSMPRLSQHSYLRVEWAGNSLTLASSERGWSIALPITARLGGVAAPYAALSYVWGAKDVPQLKHTSVGDLDVRLKSPGGLADHWEDIPHTVRDAIALCQEIGIPYLFYQRACLTIVAASGQDSRAGLPGVRPRLDRADPIIEKVGDMFVGLYAGPSQKMIRNAKWNNRVWTFQEMIFPKRLLIFTGDEVLYECDAGVLWRETVFAEHPALPSLHFSIPSSDPSTKLQLSSLVKSIIEDGKEDSNFDPSDVSELYLYIVEQYMRRQMTHPSDVLRALQGVLAEMGERSRPFFNGIPLGCAYQCLLFDIIGYRNDLRRPNFPSWSWCGWQNINVVVGASSLGLRFKSSSEVSWFRPETVIYRWDPPVGQTKNTTGLYPFVAIEGRGLEIELRHLHIDAIDKADGWARELANMLVFSADTMHVTISAEGELVRWDSDTRRYTIVSPELDLNSIDLNKPCRQKQGAAVELMALAEAKAFEDGDFLEVDDATGHVFPRIGWADHPVPLVAALMVETDLTTGISRRLGLYEIAKESWNLADRAVRTVYLC
ncbi:hypothetical protein C8A03DRAFT_34345 [Achaetomium macrosporum]|uniref:Heterokaryon incompatibility domain-containing protein n=1 Tax=Achaetomium macrosporum TaxID=79813 RepID=A0AAN7C924_9PEZI|nr:hypothetical protein C8A03DRAFT_34345 [Achaetomium macrosporum]